MFEAPPKTYPRPIRSFFFSLVLIVVAVFGQNGFSAQTIIHGKLVQPTGHYRTRYIIVENGIIQSVQRTRPQATKGSTFIYTKGYIYPGLIDLHTHLSYNILPLWENAQAQFNNRFEWRKDPHYRANVRPAYRSISDKKTDPDFYNGLILFDEMQAVAGGTTLIQESNSVDEEVNTLTKRMVVRGTDYPKDLELKNNKRIISIIDLFEHRLTTPPKPKRALNFFATLRSRGELQAFIPHLAEGRTGFLRDHSFDPYSRKEFEALMNHDLFSDPETTEKPPIALIHASGMDPKNKKHIQFLKTWNMGIVWSPVSNLLLYGDTLDIETLFNSKIPVALGSDWSPSGSKHVLDEARMARFYLDTLKANVSDATIFQMMTIHAAKMIGHPKLGRIRKGYLADLFIIDDPTRPLNGMEALFKSPVENISLVMIRGRAVYGDREILKKFSSDIQNLPERERVRESVSRKTLYVDPQIGLVINDVVERIEDHLKNNFNIPRSNTLSTTDVPYQERIKKLKTFITETFSKQ